MDSRQVLGILAVLAGVSLVLAPVTMADWSEQATLSTDSVDEAQLHEDVPTIPYQNLSMEARNAVERAISSSDGSVTIYGKADWPDRFFYSDYIAPGRGLYAIEYRDDLYRLTTNARGGFAFTYWIYELPVIVYGVVLLWVGLATAEGVRSRRFGAIATIPAVSFHLLGPAFDFPLLSPRQFVGFGGIATIGLVAGILVSHFRQR